MLLVCHSHGRDVPHWADRWLKYGFHHVFVCMRDDEWWIRVDAKVGVPVVETLAPCDFDLVAFYRGEGYNVLETRRRSQLPILPFAYANCVGLAKAFLGIRAPFVVTPYQLFRYVRALDEADTPRQVGIQPAEARASEAREERPSRDRGHV